MPKAPEALSDEQPRGDWRGNPPTQGQVTFARRLGLQYSSKATRGELFDLIVARTGLSAKRRYQFGVRRLLLWTTALALLLGAATPYGTVGFFAVGWIIILIVIRTAVGWEVAGLTSVITGTVAMAIVSFSAQPGLLLSFFFPFIGWAIGLMAGICLFGIAEALYQAVCWTDNLMQTPTVEPEEDA